jgi:HicA toxin of bacterial toxin-antitoxin,
MSNVSRHQYSHWPRIVPSCGTIGAMKRKHRRTLELIFAHPTSGNVQWKDVEALFRELKAEIGEREGSRVAVVRFGEVRVFHRPHPSPNTDKGAVVSIRKWFEQHGVVP